MHTITQQEGINSELLLKIAREFSQEGSGGGYESEQSLFIQAFLTELAGDSADANLTEGEPLASFFDFFLQIIRELNNRNLQLERENERLNQTAANARVVIDEELFRDPKACLEKLTEFIKQTIGEEIVDASEAEWELFGRKITGYLDPNESSGLFGNDFHFGSKRLLLMVRRTNKTKDQDFSVVFEALDITYMPNKIADLLDDNLTKAADPLSVISVNADAISFLLNEHLELTDSERLEKIRVRVDSINQANNKLIKLYQLIREQIARNSKVALPKLLE
jgi:hypothetical protein